MTLKHASGKEYLLSFISRTLSRAPVTQTTFNTFLSRAPVTQPICNTFFSKLGQTIEMCKNLLDRSVVHDGVPMLHEFYIVFCITLLILHHCFLLTEICKLWQGCGPHQK